jgi:hypothetical protein
MSANAASTAKAAESSTYVRIIAVRNHIITTRQALEMHGGIWPLMRKSRGYFEAPVQDPYLQPLFQQVADGWPAWSAEAVIGDLAAIGQHLVRHSNLPWFGGELLLKNNSYDKAHAGLVGGTESGQLGPNEYLGAISILAALAESDGWSVPPRSLNLGPVAEFSAYLHRRDQVKPWLTLPDLPVPEQFQQMLRDWAEGRIDITTPDRPVVVPL